MKKISSIFLLLCIILNSCQSEEVSISDELIGIEAKAKNGKVNVCHSSNGNNWHIINVNQNALAAHLAHGDIQLIDADGDGWVSFDNNCIDGGDCDDNDATVHPGSEEIPYNGKDDDCDPETPDDDLDNDGFLFDVDCDDSNPDINPDTEEICDNGIDDNCDGNVDETCGNVVYITEQTLENIYYHKEVYDEPTTLIFENLTTVPGYVYFYQCENIVDVQFPQLETVGRYIYLNGNINFLESQFPVLSSIGEYVYISLNDSLEELQFPLLETVNEHVLFHENQEMSVVNMPNLTSTGDYLYFNGNSNLTEVQLPQLLSVGNSQTENSYFYLAGNSSLSIFNAPLVNEVHGYMYLAGNTTLDVSSILCGLQDIYSVSSPYDCQDTYSYIQGNAVNTICFSATTHLCE